MTNLPMDMRKLEEGRNLLESARNDNRSDYGRNEGGELFGLGVWMVEAFGIDGIPDTVASAFGRAVQEHHSLRPADTFNIETFREVARTARELEDAIMDECRKAGVAIERLAAGNIAAIVRQVNATEARKALAQIVEQTKKRQLPITHAVNDIALAGLGLPLPDAEDGGRRSIHRSHKAEGNNDIG